MKTVFLQLWIGFCAAALVVAQDDHKHEARQAKGRVAWFVYTSVPEGLENPVSVMSGKDISQVILSKLTPSAPVKIPADGILRIVRKIEFQSRAARVGNDHRLNCCTLFHPS